VMSRPSPHTPPPSPPLPARNLHPGVTVCLTLRSYRSFAHSRYGTVNGIIPAVAAYPWKNNSRIIIFLQKKKERER